MKIPEWRSIPKPRFPISSKYVLRWVTAPLKSFIFTQICKINNDKLFVIIFRAINFLLLRWRINLDYISNEKIFKISDGDIKIFIKHKTYINLYTQGINQRLKKLESEYLLNNLNIKKKDIVIDVGACIGEVSMILCQKYNCKIFAFEPEETEFKCMKKNLVNFKFNLYNIPLWKEEKEIPFYSANNMHDSSCFEIENYTHVTKKKTSTLDKIFSDIMLKNKFKKIKLLKLEAEGAEPEILLGAKKIINNIEYISVDVGPERGVKYETTLVETVNFLKNNNFEFIKLSTPRLICLFKNKKY